MALYLTWRKFDQPIRGDAIQIHGTAVADTITLTSGVASNPAPDGAQYAHVTSDAAFSVAASILESNDSPKTESYQATTEANIFKVLVGQTTITATNL